MISKQQWFVSTTLGAALLLATGTGCAADLPLQANDSMRIERVASSRFEVALVQVRPYDGFITVHGTVKRKIPRRGAIPGSVDISLIGSDGTILAATDTHPMRRNRQAQSAHFNARLMIDPPPGSHLRIAHRF